MEKITGEKTAMEKKWLNQYPNGVPAEINPDHYASLLDLLTDSCAHYQDKTALISRGHRLSYAQVMQLSALFAAYLQKVIPLAKGDRVAILLPNTFQYIIALFGVFRAGGVVVNINPLYSAREIHEQLVDSGARVALVLANFSSVLQQALPQTQVEKVIVTELGDLFPLV